MKHRYMPKWLPWKLLEICIADLSCNSQVDLEYKTSQLYISLIPARSLSGRIPDAKTGPKISK